MNGHRERLIAFGLYSPLSLEEIARRNGILARMANGEKVDSFYKPIYCVFRAEKPYTHVQLEGERRCKQAELIADKLTGCEASDLCNRLNLADAELPLTHPKSAYRHSLYKYCKQEEWDIWSAQKAQMSIFETVEEQV